MWALNAENGLPLENSPVKLDNRWGGLFGGKKTKTKTKEMLTRKLCFKAVRSCLCCFVLFGWE